MSRKRAERRTAQSSRRTRHASIRRGSVQAAFAGLVDGRNTASFPVSGCRYFTYRRSAVFPLTKILRIGQFSRIRASRFGTAFLILLSEEPLISQTAMTSHSAILFFPGTSLFLPARPAERSQIPRPQHAKSDSGDVRSRTSVRVILPKESSPGSAARNPASRTAESNESVFPYFFYS